MSDTVSGFEGTANAQVKLSLKKVDEVPGCLCVTITGQIDTYNSHYFQQEMNKCLDAGYGKLILDASGLNYMSSTGIGAFTYLLKATKQKNGEVVILNVQPKVMEVFQLLGFSSFFPIYYSYGEAVSHFLPKKKAEIIEEAENVEEIKSVFPVILTCPACKNRMRASKAGRFRCSSCKVVVKISPEARISLD
jgi:anti-sigma B factor antagonist